MRALLGMDVVLDEGGVGRRIGPEDAGVLAMFLAAAVGRSSLAWGGAGRSAFAALQEGLELMFQLGQAAAQVGVFRFEFGNPLVTRVIHDRCSLREVAETGKSNCLTVTMREAGRLRGLHRHPVLNRPAAG